MEKIPLYKVFMSSTAGEAVNEVLYSGFIGEGEKVEEFEKKLCEYLDVEFGLVVNSCTSALQVVLHFLNPRLHKWKDIITAPLSCFATVSSIVAAGLRPRWVDVDPNTCNVDLKDLKRRINRDTIIILLVHFAGNPIDYDFLDHILSEHEKEHGYRPSVVEDCAQAFGSKSNGRFVGTHGNISCFSFQAVKPLTTGDGGFIVVPNKEIYDSLKLLRWYGLDRNKPRETQDVSNPGFKFNMNNISAAIGIENLKNIDEILGCQISNYKFFVDELSDVDGLELIEINENYCTNGCILPLKVEQKLNFEKHMNFCGIESKLIHRRIDAHSCFEIDKETLPGLDDLEKKLTCIPCGWWVDNEGREYIVDCIKKGW